MPKRVYPPSEGLPYPSFVKLTPFENYLAMSLARGMAPKEIAHACGRDPGTRSLNYFMQRLRAKLGARTTYQAVAIFVMLHKDHLQIRELTKGLRVELGVDNSELPTQETSLHENHQQ